MSQFHKVGEYFVRITKDDNKTKKEMKDDIEVVNERELNNFEKKLEDFLQVDVEKSGMKKNNGIHWDICPTASNYDEVVRFWKNHLGYEPVPVPKQAEGSTSRDAEAKAAADAKAAQDAAAASAKSAAEAAEAVRKAKADAEAVRKAKADAEAVRGTKAEAEAEQEDTDDAPESEEGDGTSHGHLRGSKNDECCG